MTTKQTNILLLVLLVITSLSLSFLLIRPKMPESAANVTQTEKKTTPIDVQNMLKASFFNSYPNLVITSDDKTISDTIKLLASDGTKLTLGKLANRKDQLVFRYSQFDCDMCIDSVFAGLDRFSRKKPNSNILVICDYGSERTFMISQKYKKRAYPVYNMSKGNLGLPIENKNFPFLFLLNSELKASKFFIPIKEFPEQTNQYLRYVLNLVN